MHFTNVGDNVWVGDFKSCNAYLKDFPLSIHIWRESNRGENRLCQRVLGGEPGEGLSVKWREGEPLSALSLPFETIMQYASRQGRLLIHCAGGVCRSTTLAVAPKIVRGQKTG